MASSVVAQEEPAMQNGIDNSDEDEDIDEAGKVDDPSGSKAKKKRKKKKKNKGTVRPFQSTRPVHLVSF